MQKVYYTQSIFFLFSSVFFFWMGKHFLCFTFRWKTHAFYYALQHYFYYSIWVFNFFCCCFFFNIKKQKPQDKRKIRRRYLKCLLFIMIFIILICFFTMFFQLMYLFLFSTNIIHSLFFIFWTTHKIKCSINLSTLLLMFYYLFTTENWLKMFFRTMQRIRNKANKHFEEYLWEIINFMNSMKNYISTNNKPK